jgi:hypothetical protein
MPNSTVKESARMKANLLSDHEDLGCPGLYTKGLKIATCFDASELAIALKDPLHLEWISLQNYLEVVHSGSFCFGCLSLIYPAICKSLVRPFSNSVLAVQASEVPAAGCLLS